MLDVTNGRILGGESEAAIHVSSAVWIAKIYGRLSLCLETDATPGLMLGVHTSMDVISICRCDYK